ncbi:MAG TPA: hypothetical protein VFN66_04825 [Burkholderiales bacterium]|nr:hypothetical protein [Burkholderiales bacterium]
MTQHPEAVADVSIRLWESMASEIISIVGTGGFMSLYARSLHLVRPSFSWLVAEAASADKSHRFAQLKTSLAGQTPEQASAANIMLLITFTDILAALIGDPLTTSILGTAWGNTASDTADKESKNE